MSASGTFTNLGGNNAWRVQKVAASFRDAPSVWPWERRFWDAVDAAAVLAEQRAVTRRPKWVMFAVPTLADTAPDRVRDETAAVLVALASLREGDAYPPKVRELWGVLAATVANERDAVLRRLREPNPFTEALVGGQVVEREVP